MKINNTLGPFGETVAQLQYQKQGFRILTKNFFNRKGKRIGEIDFIAIKHNNIHFVEVKTRSSNFFGKPEEALHKLKKIRLERAAQYFLIGHRKYKAFMPHIDLVAIEINRFDKSLKSIKIYSDCIF